jgi:hypothetical protein
MSLCFYRIAALRLYLGSSTDPLRILTREQVCASIGEVVSLLIRKGLRPPRNKKSAIILRYHLPLPGEYFELCHALLYRGKSQRAPLTYTHVARTIISDVNPLLCGLRIRPASSLYFFLPNLLLPRTATERDDFFGPISSVTPPALQAPPRAMHSPKADTSRY